MKTAVVTIFVLSVSAFAGEKTIAAKDLPAAVQKAVQEQSKGATIKGYSRETENGKTVYEAEMTVNGHGKDVTFDAEGKIVSIEEEVAITAIPAPAADAIKKAAGKRKITKLETVAEAGKVFYEAQIKGAIKSSEVKVDAAGTPVK